MIQVRKSDERGKADYGWLKTQYSFSFANYYDPNFMGFQSLRVLNEDWIAPKKGFPEHPHDNMEIITIVLEGELEHRDSTGGGGKLKPGILQHMSAGTGIQHSEVNPSDQWLHLYQIWIEPKVQGLEPKYQQVEIEQESTRDPWTPLISGLSQKAAITINSDVDIYFPHFEEKTHTSWPLKPKGHAWIQMTDGSITLNNSIQLSKGDAVAISDDSPDLIIEPNSSFLLFDLTPVVT